MIELLSQYFSLPTRRKIKKWLILCFVAYATIWAVVEPAWSLSNISIDFLNGINKYVLLLSLSMAIGFIKIIKPPELIIRKENSVQSSLQNKIIRDFIQSDEGLSGLEKYILSLENALQNMYAEEVYRPETQKKEKLYQPGTVASIEYLQQKYLLVAITKTELKGHIPIDNCDVTRLWIALQEFWQNARYLTRGSPVNIPLIGSGVTGISLHPNQLLELNVLAIINALSRSGPITSSEIRIILHPRFLDDIDLDNFQKIW